MPLAERLEVIVGAHYSYLMWLICYEAHFLSSISSKIRGYQNILDLQFLRTSGVKTVYCLLLLTFGYGRTIIFIPVSLHVYSDSLLFQNQHVV